MLKDFSKLETFLTVVREKSFSKASAKLGISQPAVTQQIKYIEEYLDTKIVERKKNGIRLTKEGEDLLRVAQKLERAIGVAEKSVIKIINKEFTFKIGASNVIGNYILPKHIPTIQDKILNEVHIHVDGAERVIEDLLDKKIDLALIEHPVMKDGLIYREWKDDELVIFSKKPIPKYLKKEDLFNYNWICRDEPDHIKQLMMEVFEDMGVDCSNFNIKGIVNSSTAVKETILHSNERDDKVTVSVMSRHAIKEEIENERSYEARLKNYKIKRKFYIVYSKERKHDAFIENVVDLLMSIK